MPISFRTGATASSGAASTASQAITIPAGVLAGDVIMVVFAAFRTTGAETMQASSTGTAPVIIGSSQQSPLFSGSILTSAIFRVVAAASDAGKVITGSLVSGDTAQWAAALGVWSGASNSAPVDVNGAATSSGASATITCPTLTTTVAGDWTLQIAGAALGGATFTGGAGFTQRAAISDASSGATGLVYDSNTSAGPAGTSIGGAVFANAGHNNWWVGFTVGLAPAFVPRGQPPQVPDDKPFLKKLLYLS